MELCPVGVSPDDTGMDSRAPIVLVTAANAPFARSMCVAIHSALKHIPADREVILYVLDDGIRPADKARALQVLRDAKTNLTIEWIDPDLSLIEGLVKPKWHTRTTYLRFLIEYLVPEQHQRVLYLDSDVVVRADVSRLWDFDMGSYPFWAAANHYPSLLSNNMKNVQDKLEPAPASTLYCNAGIMLMNMPRWREMELSRIAIDFLATHGEDIAFGDQDGLNGVLRGGWGVLDPEWNVQLLTVEKVDSDRLPANEVEQRARDILEGARILHYTGPYKPWHMRYKGYRSSDYFDAYYDCGWDAPLTAQAEIAGLRVSQATGRLLRQVKAAMF